MWNLFKVYNKDTRAKSRCHTSVFIVNFKQVSHIVLEFQFVTLIKKMPAMYDLRFGALHHLTLKLWKNIDKGIKNLNGIGYWCHVYHRLRGIDGGIGWKWVNKVCRNFQQDLISSITIILVSNVNLFWSQTQSFIFSVWCVLSIIHILKI